LKQIKVVLRNPYDRGDLVDYTIETNDTLLSEDWTEALKGLLSKGNLLEKNYCFMGFPHTARNLAYLCREVNDSIFKINLFNRSGVWQRAGLESYVIEDYFTPDNVRFGDEYPIGYDESNLGLSIKHETMNKLHNHFERLQGTVWGLSNYYKLADYETKYAIRQLNNLCHEMETLCLSQRKQATTPQFVRPSQITTFLHADRHDLKDEHREGFISNGFDRVFGGVYMHWTQIGKTLFEVFRDEDAPELTDTVCEAITELRYYSGEFDVEWGQDVVLNGTRPWHTKQINEFTEWLIKNGRDPLDPKLSLGYLPMGQITLKESFGTTHPETIWQILGTHLDIYKIEVDRVSNTFEYCWTDLDYKQQQINMMKPGYDYSSSGR
jgi:hypothetical protein